MAGFKPVFLFRKETERWYNIRYKKHNIYRGDKMEVKDLINQLITPMGQVALIMALAELFKQCGFDKKWIPVVDVILGLVSGLGVFYLLLHYSVPESIILGLALGLSACGLFSGVKNITQGVKGDENNG